MPRRQARDVDAVVDRNRNAGQRQVGQVRPGGQLVGGPASPVRVDHLKGADPRVVAGNAGEAGLNDVTGCTATGTDLGSDGDRGVGIHFADSTGALIAAHPDATVGPGRALASAAVSNPHPDAA